MIKTEKICYIFDLDDCLIKSLAKIDVYRNEAFYLSLKSNQYKNFKKEKNDVLDFREFKDGELIIQAKHYKMWPFFKKINHLIRNKKIAADLFILTARNPVVKSAIYTLCKNDGIILDMKHIITMGDDRGDLDIAEEKKQIVEALSKRYLKILFFDDDIKNIQLANKISNVETKLVESIKHLKPRSEEEIRDYYKKISTDDLYDMWNNNQLSKAEDIRIYKELKRRGTESSEDIIKYMKDAVSEWFEIYKDELNESIKHLTPRSSEEIKAASKEDVKAIIRSNKPFFIKIIELKNIIGDIRTLSRDQRNEILKDAKPNQKLEAAFVFKDKELANEAIEEGATLPQDVDAFGLLDFLANAGISMDKFIENNINNSKAIACLYLHYKNNSVYKPIIKKIIKNFNPNKLFRFAIEANNRSYYHKEMRPEIKDYLVQSIKKGATNVNVGHNELLQDACDSGNVELVRILLKSPYVDPGDTTSEGIQYNRDESNWAIRRAATNGYTEIVKLLLKDDRVDPTARNNFAIRWAAKNGHKDVIRLLLKDRRVLEDLSKEDIIKIFKLTK